VGGVGRTDVARRKRRLLVPAGHVGRTRGGGGEKPMTYTRKGVLEWRKNLEEGKLSPEPIERPSDAGNVLKGKEALWC